MPRPRKTSKKLTAQQKRFVQRFVDMAYENMAIERETPLSRREAHQRYRKDALDLVKDNTYKNINL